MITTLAKPAASHRTDCLTPLACFFLRLSYSLATEFA